MSASSTTSQSRRTADGPFAGTSVPRIPLTAFGMSLGLFLVISYVLCVLFGLAFPGDGMRQLLATMLPGFTWLTFPSFILGLIGSFAHGWYAAIVFVPLYNWFSARLG